MSSPSRSKGASVTTRDSSVLFTLLGFVLVTSSILLFAIAMVEMLVVSASVNVLIYFVASGVSYKLGRFVLFKLATRPLLSLRDSKNGRRRSRYYSAI